MIDKFGWREDDAIVTSSSVNGEDLRLSPLARADFPYSIEGKNQEKLNIFKALEQAEKNAGNYRPIVVFSKNRTEIYVALKLKHFLELH